MRERLRTLTRALLTGIDVLWVLSILAVCAAWWLGVLLKDASPYTAPLFYIPHVLIAVLGTLWLFFTLSHKFRIVQFLTFLTIAACFVKMLVIDMNWNRRPGTLPDDNIRILHCNTAEGVLGVESLARELAEKNPDVVVITEPPRLDNIADIAHHALGMPHVLTSHGLTVASRYPLSFMGERLITGGHAFCSRVDTDRGTLLVFAVNITVEPEDHRPSPAGSPVEWVKMLPVRAAAAINAGINTDRSEPIRRIAEWARDFTNKLPRVVIGDMSTPLDSTALKPLHRFTRYAYEENGRGWPYTWPASFPAYAVDQAWVSFDVRVNDYFFEKMRFSSHMRQVVDFSLEEKKFLKPGEGAR